MKILRLLLPVLCCGCLLAGCVGRTDYAVVEPSPYEPPPSTTASIATTTTTTQLPVTTTAPQTARTKVKPQNGRVLLEVPTLNQYPDFPSGCEPVAATMVLQYHGIDITTGAFVNRHLPCDSLPQGGKGPDPNEVFVGNPRSANYAYGCLSGAIETALADCVGDKLQVVDASGSSLDELCHKYIDYGIPVMVWATIGMVPVGKGASWTVPDDSTFTWPVNEHCLVLVGYDETRYYFNDPRNGKVDSCISSIARQRYEDMGQHAIALV